MKLTNIISTSAIALAASALFVATAHAAETYKIDESESEVTFKIMNKAPGEKEATEVPGKFTDFSGTVLFDKEDPSKSSVNVEVSTDSVDTANAKRDAHLKNQDFFKVKEHPKMTFKSTEVELNKDGDYAVKGDFTLLGVTKPIDVVFKKDGDHNGVANFKIKRSDYGMKYRIPDTADEVVVMIKVVVK